MVFRKLNEYSVLVQLDKRELNEAGLKPNDFEYATDGAREFLDKVMNRIEEQGLLENLKETPIKLSICSCESLGMQFLVEKMVSEDLGQDMGTPTELDLPPQIKEFLEKLMGKAPSNQEKGSEENKSKESMEREDKSNTGVDTENRNFNEELTCMYCFDSLDDVIKVSATIHNMLKEDLDFICDSKLFKHKDKYYMVVSFENGHHTDLNLILSGVVTEFGAEEETRNKDILIAFMNEHAEVIVKSDVITKLGNL